MRWAVCKEFEFDPCSSVRAGEELSNDRRRCNRPGIADDVGRHATSHGLVDEESRYRGSVGLEGEEERPIKTATDELVATLRARWDDCSALNKERIHKREGKRRWMGEGKEKEEKPREDISVLGFHGVQGSLIGPLSVKLSPEAEPRRSSRRYDTTLRPH